MKTVGIYQHQKHFYLLLLNLWQLVSNTFNYLLLTSFKRWHVLHNLQWPNASWRRCFCNLKNLLNLLLWNIYYHRKQFSYLLHLINNILWIVFKFFQRPNESWRRNVFLRRNRNVRQLGLLQESFWVRIVENFWRKSKSDSSIDCRSS